MSKERELNPQFVFPLSRCAVDSGLIWLNDLLKNPIVNLEFAKGDLEDKTRQDYLFLIDMTNLRGDLQKWSIKNRRAYQVGFLFGLKVIGNRYDELGKTAPNLEDARSSYFKSLLVNPHKTIESDPEYNNLVSTNSLLDASTVSPQVFSLLKRKGELPEYIGYSFDTNSRRKKTEIFSGEPSLHGVVPQIQGRIGMVDAEFFAYGVLDAYSPYQLHETVKEAASVINSLSF